MTEVGARMQSRATLRARGLGREYILLGNGLEIVLDDLKWELVA